MFCFFVKQKTAYEMRISDWSSDVCSSDLAGGVRRGKRYASGDNAVHAVRRRATADRVVAEVDDARHIDLIDAKHPGSNPEFRLVLGNSRFETLRHVERSEERRVGTECDSTCRSRW